MLELSSEAINKLKSLGVNLAETLFCVVMRFVIGFYVSIAILFDDILLINDFFKPYCKFIRVILHMTYLNLLINF